MHFVALRDPKSKKLLPQTLTKIKFGTKYQILGFWVTKCFFTFFAPPCYTLHSAYMGLGYMVFWLYEPLLDGPK